MIDHSHCDHPRTPSGRAKCRRANGVSTPKAKRGAKIHYLALDDADEIRPADKARCCYNCGIRIIEWKGTIPLTGQYVFTCEKCKYLIVNATDLQAMEV